MARLAHTPDLPVSPPTQRAPSRLPPFLGATGIILFLLAFLGAGLGLLPLAAGLAAMTTALVLYGASLALSQW